MKIDLVPLCPIDEIKKKIKEVKNLKLKELLETCPSLITRPVDDNMLNTLVKSISINFVNVDRKKAVYVPINFKIDKKIKVKELKEADSRNCKDENSKQDEIENVIDCKNDDYPESISEKQAVRMAYRNEIKSAASFLEAGLSVLVVCEKLIVEYLWNDITTWAKLEAKLLEVKEEPSNSPMSKSLRQRQLEELKVIIHSLKEGQVLVVPHLDLIASCNDTNMPTEARELTELLYGKSDRKILAFADRSMNIPEVLVARFAVRLMISGVPRVININDNCERFLGNVMIEKSEAEHFKDYNPTDLYKNVAGMNPLRLRSAIKYAVNITEKGVHVSDLYKSIRTFKVQTSAKFELPNVTFDDIGGYEDVKMELNRAIGLLLGVHSLPDEKLRNELLPRGIIFYGPPGTGKTLFAKAIANKMNATIQVVSGPEVTDMYVGESERKVRELFAEARRNAPSVLVFDEFDSIATKRSGREDGGSRAGNALVAQILTEMDGFRPEVPMLIIGTTNRLDIVDEALLRPSRFKPITITLPDLEGRRAIIKIHAKKYHIELSDGLVELIAIQTNSMNGDEIQSLFRDACIGLHCEEPKKPVDAYRFGFLVGSILKAVEQKKATTTINRQSRLETVRQGERPSPSGNMIVIS